MSGSPRTMRYGPQTGGNKHRSSRRTILFSHGKTRRIRPLRRGLLASTEGRLLPEQAPGTTAPVRVGRSARIHPEGDARAPQEPHQVRQPTGEPRTPPRRTALGRAPRRARRLELAQQGRQGIVAHRCVQPVHLPAVRRAVRVTHQGRRTPVVLRPMSRLRNSRSFTRGTGVLRVRLTVHLPQVQPDPHLFAPVHCDLRLHPTWPGCMT